MNKISAEQQEDDLNKTLKRIICSPQFDFETCSAQSIFIGINTINNIDEIIRSFCNQYGYILIDINALEFINIQTPEYFMNLQMDKPIFLYISNYKKELIEYAFGPWYSIISECRFGGSYSQTNNELYIKENATPPGYFPLNSIFLVNSEVSSMEALRMGQHAYSRIKYKLFWDNKDD